MSSPLVSIITPCFNGEEFLDGYFRSILDQTYENLELIFIDDGSTDATGKIAQAYRGKLEQKNVRFIYIYQENQGQAAAVNQGLAVFHGDYFVWPDSDDLLSPDSIEKRVNFLEAHAEYDIVRSNGDFFDYNTGKRLYRISENPNRFHTDIFMDLILQESYCYCGCYMVRREAFLSVYPNRRIEVCAAGQNWQILIPLTSRFQCGLVDEDLYHIAVRSNSHSRQVHGFQNKIQQQTQLKKLLLSCIRLSGRTDRNYEEIVEHKYYEIFFHEAMYASQDEEAVKYYLLMKKTHCLKSENRQQFLDHFHPLAGKLYSFWKRGCNKLKRTLRM